MLNQPRKARAKRAVAVSGVHSESERNESSAESVPGIGTSDSHGRDAASQRQNRRLSPAIK
jgi:hypothetical protein